MTDALRKFVNTLPPPASMWEGVDPSVTFAEMRETLENVGAIAMLKGVPVPVPLWVMNRMAEHLEYKKAELDRTIRGRTTPEAKARATVSLWPYEGGKSGRPRRTVRASRWLDVELQRFIDQKRNLVASGVPATEAELRAADNMLRDGGLRYDPTLTLRDGTVVKVPDDRPIKTVNSLIQKANTRRK